MDTVSNSFIQILTGGKLGVTSSGNAINDHQIHYFLRVQPKLFLPA